MTRIDPRPSVCEDQIVLPLGLFLGALRMETVPGAAELSDVEEAPTCKTQVDHPGAHHGLVLDLAGPDTGAVWAVWTEFGEHLVVLPDCPASSEDGMTACGLYDGHPAGHTWQLYDPLMAAVRRKMATPPGAPS
jgi:hypothetical protein